MKSATWKVFAACMVAGQIVSPVLVGIQGRPPFAPGQLRIVVVAGVALGAWFLFSAWTWRRLVLTRNDKRDSVRSLGVLGWGIPVWITSAVYDAVQEVDGLGDVYSAAFVAELVTSALIMFPLALWGGYFFGAAMAGVFPPPKSER